MKQPRSIMIPRLFPLFYVCDVPSVFLLSFLDERMEKKSELEIRSASHTRPAHTVQSSNLARSHTHTINTISLSVALFPQSSLASHFSQSSNFTHSHTYTLTPPSHRPPSHCCPKPTLNSPFSQFQLAELTIDEEVNEEKNVCGVQKEAISFRSCVASQNT